MKLLVLDNYDSFTYNLVHLVEKITDITVDVFTNDQISLEEVDSYDRIILSPGPSLPKQAGILLPLIKKYASKKNILGICLGHQAIAEAFGGKLTNLLEIYHGIAKPCIVKEPKNLLFKGLPTEFNVGRYNSWVVSHEDLPEELIITALDDEGNIMALQHIVYKVCSVQFHPESVLTPLGEQILRNWLNE